MNQTITPRELAKLYKRVEVCRRVGTNPVEVGLKALEGVYNELLDLWFDFHYDKFEEFQTIRLKEKEKTIEKIKETNKKKT